MPLSSWILEIVEASEEESIAPALGQDLKRLREELRMARKTTEEKDLAIKSLEIRLFRLQAAQSRFDRVDLRPIDTLRDSGTWSSRDLLSTLGTDLMYVFSRLPSGGDLKMAR